MYTVTVSMPATALAALLLAASALMGAPVVHAQQDDAMRRAVVLFEESEVAYNEGRFEEAAAMLRRAYSLHADATLLFNLARAEEGMGDLTAAIDSYERYLTAAPDAPDHGAIEARVATLRRQRDELSAAEADDHAPGGDDGANVAVAPEPAERQTGGVTPLPWIVAGVGVAVIGAGVVLGVVSQGKSNEAAIEPVQVTAADLHSEASTFATLANVMFIAGGIVAAAGVAWGVIRLTSGGSSSEAGVEADLVPGGVVLHGRF